jgi:hypothetical protein
MRRNIFAVFTLILFLYSCGQDESSAGGDRDISINGDIAINANITSELRNDIQIVSAIGKKPGLNNPIETIINLQNVSNAEKEILVKGIWLDSRGNNYGGSSTIVKLASNQSQILTAGTRSKKCIRLQINNNIKQLKSG